MFKKGRSDESKVTRMPRFFGPAVSIVAVAMFVILYSLRRGGVVSGSALEAGMLIILIAWLPWELTRIVLESKQKL